MSPEAAGASPGLVESQTGRPPRAPWRVAASCSFGYPTVIVSPSVLADGSRFPTWAWLTCPHLVEAVSRLESEGAAAQWAWAAANDVGLAQALIELDAEVRAARCAEGDGADACDDVGIAGQRRPLGVKCLHAHVAYALAGLNDPIGRVVVETIGRECTDARCRSFDAAAVDRRESDDE